MNLSIARLVISSSLLLLGGLACGGGGGGGGPTPPPGPTPGVTFTPSPPSGVNRVLMRHENPGSLTTFVLQIDADQMTGLYGLGFDLSYPTAQLTYVSAEEGPFLGAGGVGTSIQVVDAGAGRLIVGASRQGDVSGASGSGTILRLVFSVGAAGSGSLQFSSQSAFGPSGGARGDVLWFGGSISVIR